MDKEYVVEGNKLLAHFMGYEYIPHNNPHGWRAGWWKRTTHPRFRLPGMDAQIRKISDDFYLGRNHHNLRYYNSWDWMMSVVDKLEDDGFSITIGTTECEVWYDGTEQARISFERGVYSCTVFMSDDNDFPQEGISGLKPIDKLQAVFILTTQLLKHKTNILRIFA